MDDTREARKLNERIKLDEDDFKRKQAKKIRKLTKILKKQPNERSASEEQELKTASDVLNLVEYRVQKSKVAEERSTEIEDSRDELVTKCSQLVKLIKSSNHVVIYTGAGISTSANIPDYRGPNGVWTQLSKTGSIAETRDIALAEPTLTHLLITEMYKERLVKHIVSQNCDGLHIRSGLPQKALSEIHGNMFVEVCSNCKLQYFRDFDVTEKTAKRKHQTGRKCHDCPPESGNLVDTIVHFGERNKHEWPLNWKGAVKSVEKADLILCLGTSLKILRSYSCLWPKKSKTKMKLAIVNLQWTPKDSQAFLKINGKCDEVMTLLAKGLKLDAKEYTKSNDPLARIYIPLRPDELGTCKRIRIFSESTASSASNAIDDSESTDRKPKLTGWFGQGLRIKQK